MEHAVPTDAGEILGAWDIKGRLDVDRRFYGARIHIRATLGNYMELIKLVYIQQDDSFKDNKWIQ
jgi:hypothetical protein